MSNREVYERRAIFALECRAQGCSMAETARILRLGSKEQARRHVARGERLARERMLAAGERIRSRMAASAGRV